MMVSRATWLHLLLLSVVVFTVNYILPSDINNWSLGLNFSLQPLGENTLLAEEVAWRYADSEMGRRPLMINLLYYGVRATGWSYIIVFILVQLVGYLGSTAAAIGLSKELSPDASPAATYLPFLLLFPQVFLFVAHAHTFDDLYQYLVLILTLLAVVRRRFVLGWLCLVAACFIRETSVLYLPVVAYLLYRLADRRVLSSGLYVGTAAAAAAALLWLYLPAEQLEATVAFTQRRRFTAWAGNFSTGSRISESLCLPLFILGPFLLLLRWHWREVTHGLTPRCFVHGFIALGLVNTLVVWVAATAAEARLFMLPVFLILPVLAPVWDRFGQRLTGLAVYWRRQDWFVLLFIIALVQLLYYPTVGGTGYAFRAYAVGWTVGMYLLYRVRATSPPSPRLLD